jgi:L-amino acid N-acyltransferase YncA
MPEIRIASPADAGQVAAIYRPAVVDAATSFEVDPPDAVVMARRIEATLATRPWIVLADSDAVLGYAYASAHRERAAYRWSVETSAYVHPDRHRRGIGRALYSALFGILTLQGYVTACAGITLPNDASVGLHRAVGFDRVGVYHAIGSKFGRWYDVLWMERRIATPAPQPAEPIPLPQIDRDLLAHVMTRALEESSIEP